MTSDKKVDFVFLNKQEAGTNLRLPLKVLAQYLENPPSIVFFVFLIFSFHYTYQIIALYWADVYKLLRMQGCSVFWMCISYIVITAYFILN